jgi:hypothetical protein
MPSPFHSDSITGNLLVAISISQCVPHPDADSMAYHQVLHSRVAQSPWASCHRSFGVCAQIGTSRSIGDQSIRKMYFVNPVLRPKMN